MSGRAVHLAIPIAFAVGLYATSCGGGAPEPDAGAGARAAKGAPDPAVKKRRQELEEKIGVLSNALTNAPLDVDRTTTDCDKYIVEATDSGFGDLVQKLEGMKKDAKDAFERAAEKEIREACETAHKYAAEGDIKKARNRLNGLHKNLQKNERYWSQALRALDDVAKAERAEIYYKRVTEAKLEQFKRYGEWERAEGLLQAFLAVPAFKASPRAKEVEAQIAEVKPKADQVRAARADEKKKIHWVPAFKGAPEDMSHWELADYQSCSVAGEVLTFRHGDEERDWLYIMYGQEEWEDYTIEVKFRVIKGYCYVNVHGFLAGEGDEKNRNWQQGTGKLAAEEYGDKDRWYKIRLVVRGGELSVTLPGSTVPSTKKLSQPKGPFEIRIPKGAEIAIKSVWVSVSKPAAVAGE